MPVLREKAIQSRNATGRPGLHGLSRLRLRGTCLTASRRRAFAPIQPLSAILAVERRCLAEIAKGTLLIAANLPGTRQVPLTPCVEVSRLFRDR